MILDDLNFQKIEERLYVLDKEIAKIKEVEKEKAQLIKYRSTLEQYRILKAKDGSRLNSNQNDRALRWYTNFPYLALSKGEFMTQKELARYSTTLNEDLHHGKQQRDMLADGRVEKIETYLRQFCDEPKPVKEEE